MVNNHTQKYYNTIPAASNARAAMMSRSNNDSRDAESGLEFMTGRRRRKQKNSLVCVFVIFMGIVFLITLQGSLSHHPAKVPGRSHSTLTFSPPPSWDDLKYLFIFGDSYTDTGFRLSNGLPSLHSNPMGNPAFPGVTSSSYTNWVGYLTTEFNRSAVLTYDFAVGGATVNDNSVVYLPPNAGVWQNTIRTQIEDEFLPAVSRGIIPKGGVEGGFDDGVGGWTSDNSLFVIWIGINDVNRSYWDKRGKDMVNLHEKILEDYMELVGKLHKAGARRFIFIDVPPVDRSPGTVFAGPERVIREGGALRSFNNRLSRTIPKNTVFFKSSDIFNDMMDHPDEYGLKNVKRWCRGYLGRMVPSEDYEDESCGGVKFKEFFWVDGLHPTSTPHKEVAKRLAEFLDRQPPQE